MFRKNTPILIACVGIAALLLFYRLYGTDWKQARLLIWFLGGGFLLSFLWALWLYQEKTKALKRIVEERSRDMTEQQIVKQQLLRSEKLAALGDMVAGVSHEISTPLGASLLSATYLQDITDALTDMLRTGKLQLPDVQDYAEKIAKASTMIVSNLQRASELLNSFKNVAVDQIVEEKREFNIKKNMEETLNSLKPKYKNTPHVITLQCPDDLMICHYPGVFSQITTNLVMNSLIHGLERGAKGEIRITIEKQGDILFLRFYDSGRGMDATTQKKMYDPFFTTKRNTGGTGLGLHIVHNLVCQTLMGQITCISSPGNGTEFQIKIPYHGAT